MIFDSVFLIFQVFVVLPVDARTMRAENGITEKTMTFDARCDLKMHTKISIGGRLKKIVDHARTKVSTFSRIQRPRYAALSHRHCITVPSSLE